jgi:hypothetical protein
MRNRLAKSGVVAAILVVSTVGLTATCAEASTGAGPTIDGCLIVASPTSAHHTSCPAADLSTADLSSLNLTGANLTGANLTDANLSKANLTGVNMAGANLTGVNLTGAMLTGVARSHTTCPDGSKSQQVDHTCVNDVMVLEGAAIGSAPAGVSALAGPVPSSASSGSAVPSSEAELSALPFTGFPTLTFVTGLGFLGVGFLLILVSEARRKRPVATADSIPAS